MGYGKFAQVTSALLSRKGEAAPSVIRNEEFMELQTERAKTLAEILGVAPETSRDTGRDTGRDTVHDMGRDTVRPLKPEANHQPRHQAQHQPLHREASEPVENISLFAPAVSASAKRRIVLTLGGEDYERLAIAAVKLHSTPHDLALGALFEHLEAYAREHAGACQCLNSGQCLHAGGCGCADGVNPAQS